jgi:hypothetical protein
MTRGSLDGETNAGIQDIFVAKYNSSGTRQWTRMLGSAVFDYCYSVAVDASENVYVAGDSYGHFDGWSNTDGSGTTQDVFLAKFNASGTKQWSVFHGGTGNDVASGLAVDSSGNAYISGNTNALLDGFTPAGDHDLILIKYNTSGTRQWTTMLGPQHCCGFKRRHLHDGPHRGQSRRGEQRGRQRRLHREVRHERQPAVTGAISIKTDGASPFRGLPRILFCSRLGYPLTRIFPSA